MSRPPYPHRCIGAPSDGTDFFDWTCQCGALPDIYGVATARDGWGCDCPIALRERIAEQDRHIASLDCRFAGHVAELSGKHCPPGQPCERCEAESRAERAEAERDAARKMLAECYRLSGADPDGDGWEHLWQTAVDEVRLLRQQYDEVRRESRADTDKAVAAALEAKAKEIDAKADAAFDGAAMYGAPFSQGKGEVASARREAYRVAARIVRGAP